jgi:type IV pilus assembly protein PilA
MKLKSRSGFSLVELMVVVAIIGILATVAVPNFQRFQARAKQSSAKTELSGIYTAQKAFFVEYNTYHADMPSTGFVPEGFTTGALGASSDRTRIYKTSLGNSGAPVALTSLGLSRADTSYVNAFPANTTACANANTNTAITGADATQATFNALASGCPRDRNQALDTWSIDNNRLLSNTTSGI